MDFATMTPVQLDAYAQGYLDALTERGPELTELREYLQCVGEKLASLQDENDRLYHAAYCDCHEPTQRRRLHTPY
jgi:hypothetical protein